MKQLPLLTIAILLAAVCLAQDSGTADLRTFGSSERLPLGYQDRGLPHNKLILSLGANAAYDDNIFSDNRLRRSDEVFNVVPRIAFRQERSRFLWALDYQPGFTLYRQFTGFNALSQGFRFEAAGRIAPRLELRVRDSGYYRTGVYESALASGAHASPVLTDLTAPALLNGSLQTPLLHEFGNAVRADLSWRMSGSSSLTFFGGQQERLFGRPTTETQSLFDTRGWNGGVEYSYRPTRRSVLDLVASVETLRFGPSARGKVYSGVVSYGWRWTPSWTVQIFGGPQRSTESDLVSVDLGGLAFTIPLESERWHATYGGSLQGRLAHSAFRIHAERLAQDGGGLLTVVTQTTAGAELRTRIPHRWDVVIGADYARAAGLGPEFSESRIQTYRAGVSLEHPVFEGMYFQLGYSRIRQLGEGGAPVAAKMDRNLVYAGLRYQLPEIGWGR